MQYSELHCITNFTFLRGASHPHELVTMASNLGYRALAITDECSLAGVVKAHVATFNRNIKLIIGSEFKIDSHKVIVLVTNRNSYSKLSSLILRSIVICLDEYLTRLSVLELGLLYLMLNILRSLCVKACNLVWSDFLYACMRALAVWGVDLSQLNLY